MVKKKYGATLTNWGILLLLMLVWGSSFILMKRGLEHYSAGQLALLRIAFACIFLFPFAVRSAKKINRKKLLYIAITGIVGNGIPAFLFAKAQTGIDSSLAGILNSLTPLFTLVIGILFFSYQAKWLNIAGVFIGLAGTIGLMSISGHKTLEFNFSYGIYIIIATILYGINLNIVRKYLADTDATTITAFAFLIIGIPVICILFFATNFITLLTKNPGALTGLGYIAILGVVGSGIAVILHNILIKKGGVLFAASITYLIPLVAVFWGVADGEAFEPFYVFWIALILAGVFIANYSNGRNNNRKKKKGTLTTNSI
ncbi:MAG TPA: DMT family transporter [Bacteroidales bacterium]|nr:DMT family transporter [Bacteroidales bacterium]